MVEKENKEKKKKITPKAVAKTPSAKPKKETSKPAVSKKRARKEVPAPLEEVRGAKTTPTPLFKKEKPAAKRAKVNEDIPVKSDVKEKIGLPRKTEAPGEAVKIVPPPKVMKPAVPPIPVSPKIEQDIEEKPREVPQAKPDLKPKPVEEAPSVKEEALPEAPRKILEIKPPIMLKDLASKIGVKSNELILKLMAKSIFATINQNLGEEAVKDILAEYGIEFKEPPKLEAEIIREHKELEEKQDLKNLVTRSPVVTFMGHVDHGKTSLLDFIRKTRVADKEKGGITQHIGAYEVRLSNGSVTFLDTPGHEAFTAMRARGANATDVVVLVVAADDGVMPQTKEAVDHARAAEVPIVVAINKCDLPTANIEKVKGQLSQIGLTPEDWGGKTVAINVSAKTGEGVEKLLEMLLIEAELLELKANPSLRARGVVIEGKLSSGQGPVATVLVKNGTLRVGEMVLSGMYYGRVKAMFDHKGERISEAPPSKPVSILGLSGVPMAGDEFFMVKDEKKARTLSMLKQDEERSQKMRASKRVTLEDFYAKMKEGGTQELGILLKGDVQGSIEALQKSLLELNTKDVKIAIIHADVGNINESDVMLAMVSNAVVIGFNVKVDEGAQALAAKEEIEIKIYGIIYEALQDVIAAMEGLLEPYKKEVLVGRALVKQVFNVSKTGTIAGCQVMRGKITRSGMAKLVREKEVVYEGKVSSLKRFKDDAREVTEGLECGIGLDKHNDIKQGDLIEVYQIEKVARRLDSKKAI